MGFFEEHPTFTRTLKILAWILLIVAVLLVVGYSCYWVYEWAEKNGKERGSHKKRMIERRIRKSESVSFEQDSRSISDAAHQSGRKSKTRTSHRHRTYRRRSKSPSDKRHKKDKKGPVVKIEKKDSDGLTTIDDFPSKPDMKRKIILKKKKGSRPPKKKVKRRRHSSRR